MECYSAIKKGWTTDTYYNLDEPWKHYANERSQTHKVHIVWFYLYEITGIGKSTETEHRLVVVSGWEAENFGVTT